MSADSTHTNQIDLQFDNSYAGLPEAFFAHCAPTPVASPKLLRYNQALAESLGINIADEQSLATIFAGNQLPTGATPIATAYAGHQFGQFVPQLGDGRAILLGETLDNDGKRFDIQLKGAGPTPFSRGGDGRAPIGPVLREYILSEAMHALGVPTTRALAAVATDSPVYRETELPGGVITRVGSSHLRVGTFQFFAARQDIENLQTLTDYVIQRHYPECIDAGLPVLAMLNAVVERQAKLIAHWMKYGFIHGVMNTDNMTIAGETIDYGPCAFMDTFKTDKVFSSIDHGGRYAYGNQPVLAQWNLARLAETLLPLIDDDKDRAVALATETLDRYTTLYENNWLEQMSYKLGVGGSSEQVKPLLTTLLQAMEDQALDYSLTFRSLIELAEELLRDGPEQANDSLVVIRIFPDNQQRLEWLQQWHSALQTRPETAIALMQQNSPIYIPRNHRVELAIRAAEDNDNYEPFNKLCDVLEDPFVEQPGAEQYALPPDPAQVVQRTFCGT